MIKRFGPVVSSLRDLAVGARRAIRETVFAPEVLEGFARFGYAARGLVYLLIGWLAAASALYESRPPSLGGALSTVSDLPAGGIVIGATALGLFAYAAWRLAQAVLDLSRDGWHWRGLLRRTAILVDAGLHVGLGVLAAIIALGWADIISGDEAMVEVWVELALGWPLGHWIIGGLGLGTIAMGLDQVAKARRTAFEDIQASEKVMRAIRIIGRIGLGARGVVFALIGVFFLMATWQVDSSQAGGVRAALIVVASLPLGDWSLFGMSAGLAVFGAFSVIKGWYHARPNV